LEENKVPAKRPRSYESPLRVEQADRTREKLIQAGVELVVEAGGEELTVRRVAARARVSVPTAYRYFTDRDALLGAMAEWIDAQIRGPSGLPRTADEIPRWVRLVYERFEQHDRLMRAQLSTPAGRVLRARNQNARMPELREMMERSFPAASPTTQHRLTAILQVLVNLPAWLSLHDAWGLSGVDAGRLMAWALETVSAEIRRNPNALDFEVPAASPPPADRKGRGHSLGLSRARPKTR
jgi:AcrR family transcriptional regulator